MIPQSHLPLDDLIAAAQRSDVIDTMREFYEQADRAIAEKNATCWNNGDCCRFGQYGHRLYVTALEVAYYLGMKGVDGGRSAAADGGHDDTIGEKFILPILNNASAVDTCPHAFDGRCHARDRRPLGCRIFYCDPNAQHWQGPMTEECLTRLRALHEELSVPYFYADWMAVLKALDLHSAG